MTSTHQLPLTETITMPAIATHSDGSYLSAMEMSSHDENDHEISTHAAQLQDNVGTPGFTDMQLKENTRSYRVINASTWMFLFYQVLMVCLWITQLSSNDNQSFVWKFVTSNALFCVTLVFELYLWNQKG